ncbi:hypothetical protein C8R43DRAFT_1133477 [Mycena crocata]|nr:hypothetical protein C8R43DRAFT_1133477 [Mycena crocata]
MSSRSTRTPARRASARRQVTDENQDPSIPASKVSKTVAKKAKKTAANKSKEELDSDIANHINPYSEELDKKFNIEGSAIQEVVFLRQSNDLIEKKCREHEDANAALQKELADLKAHVLASHEKRDGGSRPDDEQNRLLEELEKARNKNAHLEKQLARAKANEVNSAGDHNIQVERPKGTAGINFNIQDAMGLGECAEDRKQYVSIMGDMRDLVFEAGIKWEVPWAKTPAELKGKFYAVARERHPILKRYVNDWATDELAKQFIRNRRRNEYKKGTLQRPAEFAYLKANSAKRNPSAPRGRKGVKATTKAAKKAAKKGGSSKLSAKAKGKRRAVESEEEEKDESELSELEDDAD